jgi:LysM repeat protein
MKARHIYYPILLATIISLIYLFNKNYSNFTTPQTNTAEQPSNIVKVSEPSISNIVNSQIYSVKQGDTLYSIGKNFNMLWTVIAKVNNLEENSTLFVGQNLTIPSENEAKTVQSRTDTIIADQEEQDNLKSAQEYALAGKETLSYRKITTEVVKKSRLLIKYNFTANDIYIEKSIDLEAGIAIVEITHDESLYTVTLNSFQKNMGANTIWTPVKVQY